MTLDSVPMKDPGRIPLVLAELQRAWEGQPDLSLATLFGILDNHGIGWGSEDAALIEALREMGRRHPPQLRGYARAAAPAPGQQVPGRFLVETESPAYRLTIDPFRVSVRSATSLRQPGVWEFTRIRRCHTGEPLVIVADSGIEHRLGVVTRITLLNSDPAPEVASLDGVRRRELGDAVYQVVFDTGDTALLDHGLDLFRVSRREVHHERLKWEQLLTARPGQNLVVQIRGGAAVELAEVARILPLEG